MVPLDLKFVPRQRGPASTRLRQVHACRPGQYGVSASSARAGRAPRRSSRRLRKAHGKADVHTQPESAKWVSETSERRAVARCRRERAEDRDCQQAGARCKSGERCQPSDAGGVNTRMHTIVQQERSGRDESAQCAAGRPSRRRADGRSRENVGGGGQDGDGRRRRCRGFTKAPLNHDEEDDEEGDQAGEQSDGDERATAPVRASEGPKMMRTHRRAHLRSSRA